MAILINLGKRGFVLKEGFLNPGEQITVDQETANRLTKAYPKEIKEISVEPVKVKETVKEEKPAVAETAEEPKEEAKAEKAFKKTSRRKKGK